MGGGGNWEKRDPKRGTKRTKLIEIIGMHNYELLIPGGQDRCGGGQVPPSPI